MTGTCPGQEEDAGLCYNHCRAGYDGVGPVCWGSAPTIHGKKWVNCGMGAAKDDSTCGMVITSQILGPLEMVVFVASLGTSGAVSGAAKGAYAGSKAAAKMFGKGSKTAAKLMDKAGDLQKYSTKLAKQCGTLCKKGQSIQQKFPKSTAAFGKVRDAAKEIKNSNVYKKARNAKNGAKAGVAIARITNPDATATDMVRASAELASLVDPSGISSTVAAYSYPTCDQYYK